MMDKGQRIVALAQDYLNVITGCQVSEIAEDHYSVAAGNLQVDVRDVQRERNGEYSARVLVYDKSAKTISGALIAERVNLSSDAAIQQKIMEPLAERTKALASTINLKAVDVTLKQFRHALHKQGEEAIKAEKSATLTTHNGHESLDTVAWPLVAQRDVIPGFAVMHGYTHLFGDAGIGKSLLAHNIGLEAASGGGDITAEDFAPMKVLYLSLEMHDDEFRERHNKLLESYPPLAQDNFIFVCPEEFSYATERDRSILENTVAKESVQLVIVDSYTDFRGDVQSNDNSEVAEKVILPMMALLKKRDLSLILIDHVGWAEDKRPAGAKVVWNKASIEILMQRGEADNTSTIEYKKWRSTNTRRPSKATLVYDPKTYTSKREVTADLAAALTKLTLPASAGDVDKQLGQLLGIKERQARTRKAELVAQGYLERKGNTYARSGTVKVGQVVMEG